MDLPEGLVLIENIISRELEQNLIENIDLHSWNNKLTRRTQHYGYEYNYTGKNLNKTVEFPKFIKNITQILYEENIIDADQCIINEYYRNQGIFPHIDLIDKFGPVICSLSLGDECVMDFTKDDKKISLLLPRRSLLIMKGESRYKWKHGISKNITYIKNGDKYLKKKNYRRISMTFRTITH